METTIDFDRQLPSLNPIDENFPGLAAIEQNVIRTPSFPVVLETEEHKESNAAILDIENALSLIIKVEPEIDDYGSENVPLEVAKNIYARECIKQEQKCMVESRNNEVTKLEQNLIFDNLEHLSDSALDEFKEYRPIQEEPLVKIETNYFEEMHEVDFKEWVIKNQDLNIKEDLQGNEASISPDCDDQDNKCELCAPEKSDQFGEEISLKSHLLRELPKSDHCSHETIEETSLNVFNIQQKHPNGRKVNLLKCIKCSYQTDFKCNKCDFQTNDKCSLQTHLLRHKNSERVKTFKCDQCSYKTVRKSHLKRHLLLHGNPENVPIFKCNKCDFQTKHEGSVKTHILRHNNSEDVKTFKCDQCSYKTIKKSHLQRHFLLHKNPETVEIFKCNKCDFQTKHKGSLKSHLLRHNISGDVQNFKCDQCSYKTILEAHLKLHLIKHNMNPEKVEMFKCNQCDFQTKYKQYLKTHLLRHDNSDDVKMFKCDQCSYKSSKNSHLKRHLLLHRNPEKVEMFKCNECEFQTKHKSSLKTHRLRHMSPEEVDMFKCTKCDFQTIYERNLKMHLLRHNYREKECEIANARNAPV